MKIPPLVSLLLLTGCAGLSDYKTKSVPEAQKMVEMSVQHGIIPASMRVTEEARLTTGKPRQGTWEQARMDRWVARWVSENPRIVEINLATTRGQISEGQRLELLSRLDEAEAAARTERAAGLAAVAGALNSSAASMNATAASMNQTAAMYNAQPRTIYVKPVAPSYAPVYTPPVYTPTYSPTYRPRF